MEKSIETIWNEGFINSDTLIVPKVNDLYNQKSIHLIDKFKRMFKINLQAITLGSIAFLVASFLVGIPITGIGFFVVLNTIGIVNWRLTKTLNEIDKGASSYNYIKAFDEWMKHQISINRKMAQIYYPLFVLFVIAGLWFSLDDGVFQGTKVVDQILLQFPDTPLLFDIPIVLWFGLLFIMGILALFGGRIYTWDVNLIYKGVFKKLEEIIQDMEELRS